MLFTSKATMCQTISSTKSKFKLQIQVKGYEHREESKTLWMVVWMVV